jgi:hypothetical protein
MEKRVSLFAFVAWTILLTALAVMGIQKISPYLVFGVRVEYDSGSGWKEFQQLALSADVREIYVKKIGSVFPSVDRKTRLVEHDSDAKTETYTFPVGAPVKALVMQYSHGDGIRLMSVITNMKTNVPMFSDGLRLGDGIYSISTKNEISQSGTFKIEDGKFSF